MCFFSAHCRENCYQRCSQRNLGASRTLVKRWTLTCSLELEDSRGRESGGIIHSSPSFSSWYFLYLLLVPCFFDAVTSLQCSLSPNVLCLLYSQSVDVLNPNVVDRWILSHGLSGQQTLCKKDTDSHHPGPVMAIRSSIAHSFLLPVVTCCWLSRLLDVAALIGGISTPPVNNIRPDWSVWVLGSEMKVFIV